MHIFRIDKTTVAQDIAHLPAHQRMLIKILNAVQLPRRHFPQSPPGAGVIAKNVIFENMNNLVGPDICIADTWRAALVYNHQRLERAGAEATHLDDPGVYLLCLDMVSQALQYFRGAGGPAARCRPYEENRKVTFLKLAPLLLSFGIDLL